MSEDLDVVWTPDPTHQSRLDDFVEFASAKSGREFVDYADLWSWSTTDLNDFWMAVWEFFEIPHDGVADVALASQAMPGAVWFPGVAMNYAEVMLRLPGREDDDVVVVSRSQTRGEVRVTAAELRSAVARCQQGLARLGVGRGDRVAAYAPNIPETLVLMLASASLGAVFTSCAPEFGEKSVTDRWGQVEPKVLVAVDGYRFGDKAIGRTDEVATVRSELSTVESVVWIPYLNPDFVVPDGDLGWSSLMEAESAGPVPRFERVPFDWPLYILFSSGTTGLPKPIVHGHGGITLEHLKALVIQSDAGPDDVAFWHSTTGWMVWNNHMSILGAGSTVVMHDGNVAYPDLLEYWRICSELRVTFFATGAPFILMSMRMGLNPAGEFDLSALRVVGSTGAPLPASGYHWVAGHIGAKVQVSSTSGGTDVCTGFVTSAPNVPVVAGEISCRGLGARVEAYDDQGNPLINEVGELVITAPMPSMPVAFWGDDDGSRYHEAYFDVYPGVWRHGDWIVITDRGSCVITGRSDATLNRGGVRLGTGEFYGVLDAMTDLADSLVVHLEDATGGMGELILFVSTTSGEDPDEAQIAHIRSELRNRLSPRHLPDVIRPVPRLPRTLTGKRLEVPVKRILRGARVEDVVSLGAITNPDAMAAIVAFAAERSGVALSQSEAK